MLCDPVCTTDGHCFERAAIETWVAQRAGQRSVPSPVTNLPLEPLMAGQVAPNHALRAVVERLQQLLDEPDGE